MTIMDVQRFHLSGRDISNVAIFIVPTGEGGAHTGLIHKNNGILYYLDLRFHEWLRDSVYIKNHPYVVPSLDEDEVEDLTGMCRLILTAA